MRFWITISCIYSRNLVVLLRHGHGTRCKVSTMKREMTTSRHLIDPPQKSVYFWRDDALYSNKENKGYRERETEDNEGDHVKRKNIVVNDIM